MKYLTIDVTDEDIRRGRPGRWDQCPIARVIRRSGYRHAAVMDDEWWPNDYTRVLFPRPVTRFIRDFDNRKPVAPRRFRIVVPA